MTTDTMKPIFAMSTNELGSRDLDLLLKRMSSRTTKEEKEKLTKQLNEVDAELKRRGGD